MTLNKFTLISLFILLASGASYFYLQNSGFLDREAPTIELIDPVLAVNRDPFTLKLRLTDSKAGLAGYSIRSLYRNKLSDIFKKNLAGEKSIEENVLIDLTKFNFPQGQIKLEVRTYDRSYFSNYAIQDLTLQLDYDAPTISPLSAQHNTMPGGVEPIFYKAADKLLSITGVEQGGRFFRGYPARLIDIKFRDPNLFVAFFSVNPEDQTAPRLVAIDQSANKKTSNFNFNILPRRFSTQIIKAEQTFLDQLQNITQTNSISEIQNTFSKLLIGENNSIQEIISSHQSNKMYLSDPFLQAEGVVNFGFNDLLKFTLEKQEFLSYRTSGFFLNTNVDKPVLALQQGEVIFAGDLNIRGKTIILDHGLGISSVYTNLDQILVEKGQVVEKGLEIALPGQTGLARKIGYGLEVLSSGNQINPLNWWDQKWYQGHIENKIKEIKRLYNIPIV